MNIGNKFKSKVEYAGALAGEGWKGARSAGSEALRGEAVSTVLGRSAKASWAAAVLGMGLGALAGYLSNPRKPSISRVAASAVIGGTVGFSAGLAWETRELSGGIARGALRNINRTRDERWLSKNPIDFG